jgi:hypothetical protein
MNDREFSDIEIFQYSGKGMPLFMIDHKNCLQADYLLGPDPRLIKKRIYRAAVSNVEKHCTRLSKAVFLNRRAAARYLTLASIIPDRENLSFIFLSIFHE